MIYDAICRFVNIVENQQTEDFTRYEKRENILIAYFVDVTTIMKTRSKSLLDHLLI